MLNAAWQIRRVRLHVSSRVGTDRAGHKPDIPTPCDMALRAIVRHRVAPYENERCSQSSDERKI